MIIADSGFWLALANQKDEYNGLAQKKLEEISESLITTVPVITETCHLLLTHLGSQAQSKFIYSSCWILPI